MSYLGRWETDNQAPGLSVELPMGVSSMNGSPQKTGPGRRQSRWTLRGDSVMRSFQSSADIVRLFACRDSRYLYTSAWTPDRPLSPQVAYTFTVRPDYVKRRPISLPLSIVVLTPGPSRPYACLCRAFPAAFMPGQGSLLEAALPLPSVGLSPSAIRFTARRSM